VISIVVDASIDETPTPCTLSSSVDSSRSVSTGSVPPLNDSAIHKRYSKVLQPSSFWRSCCVLPGRPLPTVTSLPFLRLENVEKVPNHAERRGSLRSGTNIALRTVTQVTNARVHMYDYSHLHVSAPAWVPAEPPVPDCISFYDTMRGYCRSGTRAGSYRTTRWTQESFELVVPKMQNTRDSSAQDLGS